MLEGNNKDKILSQKSPFTKTPRNSSLFADSVVIQTTDSFYRENLVWENVVDNNATWQLMRSQDPANMYKISPSKASKLTKGSLELIADQNFQNIRIYYGNWKNRQPDLCLFYPYEQILMVHHLQFSRKGALLHASGVEINGKGYLFLGDSGAGKSTIAGLCEEMLGQNIVYSDDRIIVRRLDGKWKMFGTPWHGTLARMNPAGLEIAGAFFLEKKSSFECVVLNESDSLDRFLPVTFGTWWLPDRVQDLFFAAMSLTKQNQFPICRLGFTPELVSIRKLLDWIENKDKSYGVGAVL